RLLLAEGSDLALELLKLGQDHVKRFALADLFLGHGLSFRRRNVGRRYPAHAADTNASPGSAGRARVTGARRARTRPWPRPTPPAARPATSARSRAPRPPRPPSRRSAPHTPAPHRDRAHPTAPDPAPTHARGPAPSRRTHRAPSG